MMDRTKVIAEIGCNHKGDLDLAKEMIKTASYFCEVDVVKFQKRSPRELLSEEEYNTPHPVPENSFGVTYGEHREFLELTVDQHQELKNYCFENGVDYSSSVWDLQSASDIISLSPKMIKIPSACNLNKPLLELLCDTFDGEIHVSLGMTTQVEEERIVSFFEKRNRNHDLVLYSCTSGYPVPFEDINLLEIKRLKDNYSDRVKAIGFSGHHLGIAVDMGAYILGAQWIERHFTLDRTWKGTDHAASLEPGGLRKLVRDIEVLSKSLNYKDSEILKIEEVQRKKLKANQIKWTE